MDRMVLLFLSQLWLLGAMSQGEMTHSSVAMTWDQAQKYCRDRNADLVTIRSDADYDKMVLNSWLGIRREKEEDPFKWSQGNEHLTIDTRWENGCADEDKHCAFFEADSKCWKSEACTNSHVFYCVEVTPSTPQPGISGQAFSTSAQTSSLPGDQAFSTSAQTSSLPGDQAFSTSAQTSSLTASQVQEMLRFENETKTWEEALAHCRALEVADPAANNVHIYDLAPLLTDEVHQIATELIQTAVTEQVWTGLRFLGDQWMWVTGEEVQYSDINSCPTVNHCGALDRNSTWRYSMRECDEKKAFLCSKKSAAV